jgi:hypothetical protein
MVERDGHVGGAGSERKFGKVECGRQPETEGETGGCDRWMSDRGSYRGRIFEPFFNSMGCFSTMGLGFDVSVMASMDPCTINRGVR